MFGAQPSPAFETPYEPTKSKESRYHSITMMRAYKQYSFEELRISYPLKRTLKTENILVAHAKEGRGRYAETLFFKRCKSCSHLINFKLMKLTWN